MYYTLVTGALWCTLALCQTAKKNWHQLSTVLYYNKIILIIIQYGSEAATSDAPLFFVIFIHSTENLFQV